MRWLGLLLLAIVLLGAFRYAFEDGPLASRTAPTAAGPSSAGTSRQQIQADAGALRDLVALRKLRSAMKDPDSFKLEQALRMADGSLCLSYRASNSFNAVVPGHAVVASDRIVASGDPGFQAAWDRSCQGKRGDDVTFLRVNL